MLSILLRGHEHIVPQYALSKVDTDTMARAIHATLLLSLYAIPSKHWFIVHDGTTFPRLKTRDAPTPSLLLLRRMSGKVAHSGTESDCERILEGLVYQANRRGFPWSWLTLCTEDILQRVSDASFNTALRHFRDNQTLAKQYKACILYCFFNARPNARTLCCALFSDPSLAQLRVEYQIACLHMLTGMERRSEMKRIWAHVKEWPGLVTPMLRLFFLSDLMHLVFDVADVSEIEHEEPVWEWIVNKLRTDQKHILQIHLPTKMTLTLDGLVAVDVNETFEDPCCVCMEALKHECGVRIQACDHAFHGQCLYEWISGDNNNCPMCRAVIHGANDDQHELTFEDEEDLYQPLPELPFIFAFVHGNRYWFT